MNEGFIKVPGGRVWYKIVGRKKAIPLIVLHGGTGYPHDYLQPLEDLSNSRQIVFYDQLGCGNSDKPTDKALWTVDRFVTELQAVIKALGFKKYHLLGHSWGVALAVSFALTKPTGLASLILSNPYISTPRWEEDAKELIKTLPRAMQTAIKKGDRKSEGYKKAFQEYYARYVGRLKKSPVAVIKSNNKASDEIYHYMWGPSEFEVEGTLKDFDASIKLPEIKVPVLLLCGRFDEATSESTQYFKNLLPNARMEVLEKSAHHPFWSQRKEYINTVRDFLKNF